MAMCETDNYKNDPKHYPSPRKPSLFVAKEANTSKNNGQ